MLSDARKIELFDEILNYICEEISDLADLKEVLIGIGFTEEEVSDDDDWE